MSGLNETVVKRYQEGKLFTFFSLLPHENKLSVLNFTIQRNEGIYDEPIKSKEELIFMVCLLYC